MNHGEDPRLRPEKLPSDLRDTAIEQILKSRNQASDNSVAKEFAAASFDALVKTGRQMNASHTWVLYEFLRIAFTNLGIQPETAEKVASRVHVLRHLP